MAQIWLVPLKIVFNVSRFKPVLNWNRFWRIWSSYLLNSLNLLTHDRGQFSWHSPVWGLTMTTPMTRSFYSTRALSNSILKCLFCAFNIKNFVHKFRQSLNLISWWCLIKILNISGKIHCTKNPCLEMPGLILWQNNITEV